MTLSESAIDFTNGVECLFGFDICKAHGIKNMCE